MRRQDASWGAGGFCLLDRARGNPLTRKNVNRPASLIRRGGSSVGKRCVAMWVVGGGYRTLPTRRLAASRKASRLTMYGTNSHQRLHHSVDMEGALCPHIMPLALFPPFLAHQKGCARRVGALPGGGTPNGGGNIICGPTDTVDRTIKCRKFSKTLPGKRGGRFDLFPLKTAICGDHPFSFCILYVKRLQSFC